MISIKYKLTFESSDSFHGIYHGDFTSEDIIRYFLPGVILSETITRNRESLPKKRGAAKDKRCFRVR